MIQILTTGGTIDKTYNPLTGELVFTKNYIKTMLKRANLVTQFQVNDLLQKDSLEMTSLDRELIYNTCKNSLFDKILITHGTDTMEKTAQLLNTIKDKTIVLFGAMIPYSIDNSDGFFNFGYGIACVQNLKNGVYIAMNGNVFPAQNVKKNREIGKFENL